MVIERRSLWAGVLATAGVCAFMLGYVIGEQETLKRVMLVERLRFDPPGQSLVTNDDFKRGFQAFDASNPYKVH